MCRPRERIHFRVRPPTGRPAEALKRAPVSPALPTTWSASLFCLRARLRLSALRNLAYPPPTLVYHDHEQTVRRPLVRAGARSLQPARPADRRLPSGGGRACAPFWAGGGSWGPANARPKGTRLGRRRQILLAHERAQLAFNHGRPTRRPGRQRRLTTAPPAGSAHFRGAHSAGAYLSPADRRTTNWAPEASDQAAGERAKLLPDPPGAIVVQLLRLKIVGVSEGPQWKRSRARVRRQNMSTSVREQLLIQSGDNRLLTDWPPARPTEPPAHRLLSPPE